MENYMFDTETESNQKKAFVLVIYDISNNRKRQKMAKLLEGYGFRIQKSAFETELPLKKLDKLMSELSPYGNDGDSVRVYRIIGKGNVTVFGSDDSVKVDDIIVI